MYFTKESLVVVYFTKGSKYESIHHVFETNCLLFVGDIQLIDIPNYWMTKSQSRQIIDAIQSNQTSISTEMNQILNRYDLFCYYHPILVLV